MNNLINEELNKIHEVLGIIDPMSSEKKCKNLKGYDFNSGKPDRGFYIESDYRANFNFSKKHSVRSIKSTLEKHYGNRMNLGDDFVLYQAKDKLILLAPTYCSGVEDTHFSGFVAMVYDNKEDLKKDLQSREISVYSTAHRGYGVLKKKELEIAIEAIDTINMSQDFTVKKQSVLSKILNIRPDTKKVESQIKNGVE